MKRRDAIKSASLMTGAFLAQSTLSIAQTKKFRIALIMKALSNTFFHAMEVGGREEGEKLGVEMLVNGIDKETDVTQQISLVENAITKRVDAVVIAPANSNALIPPLMKAKAAGIFVVNIDNPLDEAMKKQMNFQCPFVGSDNELGAALAAHDLVAAIGGVGNVAILEGIPGVTNAELRKKGAMRVFDSEPKIKVVASKTAEWETEEAYNVFTNILTSNPDIQGLFAANDSMALGAVRAIDAAGKTGQIKITSYDNLEATQAVIKEGKIHSTIEQHPELMGAYGVRAAVDHLNGKPVGDIIPTPLEVIDYEYLMRG